MFPHMVTSYLLPVFSTLVKFHHTVLIFHTRDKYFISEEFSIMSVNKTEIFLELLKFCKYFSKEIYVPNALLCIHASNNNKVCNTIDILVLSSLVASF